MLRPPIEPTTVLLQSGLELPRQQRGLPKAILSIEEIDTIMGLPDIKTPYGIRDRAILETLYS
ncbi:MAG: hypothetical protein GY820_31390, partial [Gammaproteobacteria bacterium]|nr:hypothetical protein [Gammaproteobacteria bacterium]